MFKAQFGHHVPTGCQMPYVSLIWDIPRGTIYRVPEVHAEIHCFSGILFVLVVALAVFDRDSNAQEQSS